jgi:hypothetical protein
MTGPQMVEMFNNCIVLINAAAVLNLDINQQIKSHVINALGVLGSENFTIYNHNGTYRMLVPMMTVQEFEAARYKGKIESIRLYKHRTLLSLMDSKMAVEQIMQAKGYNFNIVPF